MRGRVAPAQGERLAGVRAGPVSPLHLRGGRARARRTTRDGERELPREEDSSLPGK